ncbi:MAG: UDP-glucose 4-epimerase GalE [Bacteroidales bacterium]|nr:UDP-glucose 4-epimerase GalE [Bacteroidales bacterium]
MILVTGGTGYIGSHTVVELINAGFETLIVDDLSNSEKEVVDRIEQICGKKPAFLQLDLKDRKKTFELFEKYPNIEAVVHFAAHKAVGESVEKPLMYYENNIGSLINLLNAMNEFKKTNFVFSSSCTVYGQPDILPVTENTPRMEAESPYGNTKKMAEDILRDHALANSAFKSIALRYFNPIGAHPSGLIGELPRGIPNNLVPFVTQTAYGLREQLSIFGNDYDTPDGTCIRDYINVVDLSKAHVVAIKRLLKKRNKSNYEYFNIGTGKGTTVLEIVKSFEKANSLKLNYKIVDRRPGDIEKIWADTTLANNELGWKAEIGLDETLASAWNWEKKYRS